MNLSAGCMRRSVMNELELEKFATSGWLVRTVMGCVYQDVDVSE